MCMSKKHKHHFNKKNLLDNSPVTLSYTLLKLLNKIFYTFLIGSTLLLVIAEATFKLYDPDIMQYLAMGRELVTHGFSDMCIFSYITQACQTVFFREWLFHLMTYGVYMLGSWNSLVLFQICIDASIFIVLLVHAKRSGFRIFSTSLFVLFAALIAVIRFQLRSDVFGLLMFTVFYVLISEYVQKRIYLKTVRTKIFYLLSIVLTIILWTNSHGSFPLLFIILLAYICADCAKIVWNKLLQYTYSAELQELKELTILLGLAVGAVFISPFGSKTAYSALQFFFSGYAQEQNMEWRSPFYPSDLASSSITFFKILIGISTTLFLVRIKKMRLADVLLFIPILYLSVTYVRNVALFSLVCALIFPFYFDDIANDICTRIGSKLKLIWLVFQSVVAVLLIYFCFITANSYMTNYVNFSGMNPRRFGLGMDELTFPVGAVQFIVKNHIHGNMFNDYSYGTYLNWMLYPQQKTFIDADTFSLKSLEYYNHIVSGQIPYTQVVDTYKINYFFFRYSGYDSIPLISRLYTDKNWKLVYFDEMSAIFLANTQENKHIIDTYGIDFTTGKNFDPDHLVSVKESINFSTGFSNRGLFLSNLGLHKDALHQFSNAVSLNKEDFTSFTNLGAAYYETGDTARAAEEYTLSIAIQTNFAPSHFNLGLIYQELGQKDKAITQFQRALSINRGYKFANFSLGTLFESKGDLETAKQYYQQELTVDPSSTDAQDALTRIEKGIPMPTPIALPIQDNLPSQHTDAEDIIIQRALLIKTPSDPDLHFRLGLDYGKTGNLPMAIDELQKAINLKPDLAIAHYNLGYAYNLQKQTDNALTEYELAKKYDPSFPSTYLNLADIYQIKGRNNEAVDALKTYLKLFPDSPQVEQVRQEISSIILRTTSGTH